MLKKNIVLVASLWFVAGVASAQDEESAGGSASAGFSASADTEGAGAGDEAPFTDKWVTLGLRTGLYIPSLANEMNPHVALALEVGVLLPVMEKQLAIVLGAAYSPPGESREEDDALADPRIGAMGGSWSYDMTTQELFLSLGPVFRFLPPGDPFVPYVGLMGRMYMLQTTVEGSGSPKADGEPAFGEHEETSTQFGGALLGGLEIRLGPGSFLAELAYGLSDLPHRITGETNTGALTLEIGYRLFL